MTEMTYVPLPGSERTALPQAAAATPDDDRERIEVTVVTRRKADLPRTESGALARISRDVLRSSYGSDLADQALVAEVLAGPDSGVEVVEQDPATRRITLAGPARALAAAFGTTLSRVETTAPDGSTAVHRARAGALKVPAALDGIVMAVLGLDNRPQAQPRLRHLTAGAAAPVSYTPPQVAQAYQFPAGTDGTGTHVAILELGGGYAAHDLDAYFTSLGIRRPHITSVGVAGGKNVPGKDPTGADGEVMLDIEVVGAVAPGARISVYFAPNTDQGFAEAVTAATHATPAPAAISISWGQSEDAWTAQARTSLDSALADAMAIGITVLVASGDTGSGDSDTSGTGVHCDFPASSPHVLGCGGTSLRLDASGAIASESVWNDGAGQGSGGGGVSDVFPLPAWQQDAGVPVRQQGQPGRGVPDVSGNADPETGYQVRVDGKSQVIGGTSAVAPLWAALVCRLTQAKGGPLGTICEVLYAGAKPGQPVPGLRDITTGTNGAWQAGAGWDPCTGLGSPGPALPGLFTGPEKK